MSDTGNLGSFFRDNKDLLKAYLWKLGWKFSGLVWYG